MKYMSSDLVIVCPVVSEIVYYVLSSTSFPDRQFKEPTNVFRLLCRSDFLVGCLAVGEWTSR